MLEINWSNFAVTIVVFLGLIAFLNAVFYKKILNFMDERSANLRSDEDGASKNLSDVEAKRAEIEEIIANANVEANKIKRIALDEAKSKSEEEVEAKRKLLEDDLRKYLTQLEKNRDELKVALVRQIPDFKSALNKKIAKI
ncbi:MAG: F0F1 ATP synthase subunit B family protein [Campylobacter sp.]